MQIYEEAAKFGFHPRFKISMSGDQPDAQFQISLSAPEWRVHATTSKPTYIGALSAVVESYVTQAKRLDDARRMTPRAFKERLDILSFTTAGRALGYLLNKLQLRDRHDLVRLDTQGPQWTYKISIKKVYSAAVPTIRRVDARYMGTTTTVVRLLQAYGYDKLDGFKEYLETAGGKNEAITLPSSRKKGEVERAGQSDTRSHGYGKLDPDEDIMSLPNANSRYSRGQHKPDIAS